MRGPDKMPRSERRSQEWQRGYQAALDDLQGRPHVGAPCGVCGEPIPPAKGGAPRRQCSRECTVAAARARFKLNHVQRKAKR